MGPGGKGVAYMANRRSQFNDFSVVCEGEVEGKGGGLEAMGRGERSYNRAGPALVSYSWAALNTVEKDACRGARVRHSS
jgi:hypothetical protein